MPSGLVRVAYVALAVGPAAAFGYVTYHGFVTGPATTVLAGLVVLSSLGAVLATVRMVFDHLQTQTGAYRLVDPSRRGLFIDDLPPVRAQRDRLNALLAQPATTQTPFPHEPETLDAALRRTILRIFAAWGIADRAAVSDDDLAEISLLIHMVSVDPGEAGRLANACLRPEQMIDIRDELVAIADRRRRFERQRDTFQATRAIWHMRRSRDVALRDSLERMALPDIDLWHHIVLEHDPSDPNQREAALWCVQQSACDKASVAAWLARMLLEGEAQKAILRGDMAFVWSIEKIISLWNSGWYTSRELGLTPPDGIARRKDEINAALDGLSERLHTTRWATPHGLFDPFEGRAVQRRDNWCLVTGTVTAPPKLEDYVEGAA